MQCGQRRLLLLLTGVSRSLQMINNFQADLIGALIRSHDDQLHVIYAGLGHNDHMMT